MNLFPRFQRTRSDRLADLVLEQQSLILHRLIQLEKTMAVQQSDIAALATSITALGPQINAAVAAASANNNLDLTPATAAVTALSSFLTPAATTTAPVAADPVTAAQPNAQPAETATA